MDCAGADWTEAIKQVPVFPGAGLRGKAMFEECMWFRHLLGCSLIWAHETIWAAYQGHGCEFYGDLIERVCPS